MKGERDANARAIHFLSVYTNYVEGYDHGTRTNNRWDLSAPDSVEQVMAHVDRGLEMRKDTGLWTGPALFGKSQAGLGFRL